MIGKISHADPEYILKIYPFYAKHFPFYGNGLKTREIQNTDHA
jgi:hypothetical protein